MINTDRIKLRISPQHQEGSPTSDPGGASRIHRVCTEECLVLLECQGQWDQSLGVLVASEGSSLKKVSQICTEKQSLWMPMENSLEGNRLEA